MAMTIELYTRDGSYVTTVPGPEIVPAPNVTALPDVVVWGVRIFVLHREQGEYREASTFAVPLEGF